MIVAVAMLQLSHYVYTKKGIQKCVYDNWSERVHVLAHMYNFVFGSMTLSTASQ
jgi:hypothetical protein